MLLGEPQVDASVSVSSLLNKAEKMSPSDTTETVTVKEASITVQETSARHDAEDDDDEYDTNNNDHDKRAASVDLSSDRSPRLPPSPKSAEGEPLPAADSDGAQTLNDTNKDAPEPEPESVSASASASARARSEESPDADKAQTDDTNNLANGGDAADLEADTAGDDSKSKLERPSVKPDSAVDGEPEKPNKEEVAKPGPTSDDNVFEIERLASHRVNKDTSTVDFFVQWVGTATSWEPERELQLQVPDLVFEYWEALGGREKATGLEEFHVFRILESTVDPPQYRVQWVGYRDTPADTTWESRALLRRVAPIALGLYESSHKKRSAKGKPGRPSKKLKISRGSSR